MTGPGTPPSVQIPVTWNDADRDGGVDHWIANATYWHDQCQQAWQTRDMVSDLQRRIDSALRMIHAVDPTSGRARMSTFLNDLRNVLDRPAQNAPRSELIEALSDRDLELPSLADDPVARRLGLTPQERADIDACDEDD